MHCFELDRPPVPEPSYGFIGTEVTVCLPNHLLTSITVSVTLFTSTDIRTCIQTVMQLHYIYADILTCRHTVTEINYGKQTLRDTITQTHRNVDIPKY